MFIRKSCRSIGETADEKRWKWIRRIEFSLISRRTFRNQLIFHVYVQDGRGRVMGSNIAFADLISAAVSMLKIGLHRRVFVEVCKLKCTWVKRGTRTGRTRIYVDKLSRRGHSRGGGSVDLQKPDETQTYEIRPNKAVRELFGKPNVINEIRHKGPP